MDERVQTFASTGELLAELSRRQAEADAAMSEVQRALTYGEEDQYFLRPYMMNGQALLIFGRIPSWDEIVRIEGEGIDSTDPAVKAEAEWAIEAVRESERDRNMLQVWAYSVLVEDGEPGATHKSAMLPITKEQFEEARSLGWDGRRCAHILVDALEAAKEARGMSTCKACAGTGDRFDREKADWAYPAEKCPACGGHGEVNQ